MPVDEDRLSLPSDGRVVVELKRPWSTTGETEVVFEPTEFLRKLAALIPLTAVAPGSLLRRLCRALSRPSPGPRSRTFGLLPGLVPP